ncbi:hypothetical protein [Nostoc sp. FACHB-280]|uniref:hypothetical protein n=1 Tax=Nostoc sp. FACHB-280 TaxID=2692839 RepID=UPI00168B87CB|nr:hypothetical protein [Nostoc sp. FACHB-280]MBD2497894.1 hypothetical protein [Nostoc sp. FACHB-280]
MPQLIDSLMQPTASISPPAIAVCKTMLQFKNGLVIQSVGIGCACDRRKTILQFKNGLMLSTVGISYACDRFCRACGLPPCLTNSMSS